VNALTALAERRPQPDVDPPQTARWILRSASGSLTSDPFGNSVAATHLLTERVRRLAAVSLPITITASAYVPPNIVEVIHKVRPTTTMWISAGMPSLLAEEAAWRYAPETVSRAEVEELQRLWSLPYPGEHEFDFRTVD
jgi:hypothetical protein